MQRDEAKRLLELCRPGRESDRQDPALADALALLETDAELREWHDAQQAIDARISEELNAIQAPAALKTDILAGMRLHYRQGTAGTDEAPSTDTATTQMAWWRHPWTGIAAVFAVLLGVMILPTQQRNTEPATLQSETLAGIPPIIEFLSREIDGLKSRGFDQRGSEAETLKAYLTSTKAPSPESIPKYLQTIPTVGCVTFEYGATQLSMICFKNGEVYHLITANKANYPGTLPNEPTVFETSDKAFKVWVEGEQVKILTTHGPKESLPELI